MSLSVGGVCGTKKSNQPIEGQCVSGLLCKLSFRRFGFVARSSGCMRFLHSTLFSLWWLGSLFVIISWHIIEQFVIGPPNIYKFRFWRTRTHHWRRVNGWKESCQPSSYSILSIKLINVVCRKIPKNICLTFHPIDEATILCLFYTSGGFWFLTPHTSSRPRPHYTRTLSWDRILKP